MPPRLFGSAGPGAITCADSDALAVINIVATRATAAWRTMVLACFKKDVGLLSCRNNLRLARDLAAQRPKLLFAFAANGSRLRRFWAVDWRHGQPFF
jgi:hypothetical protein